MGIRKLSLIAFFFLWCSAASAATLLYSENFDDQDLDQPSVGSILYRSETGNPATPSYSTGRLGTGYCATGVANDSLYLQWDYGATWPSDEMYVTWYVKFDNYVKNSDVTQMDNIKAFYPHFNVTGGTAYDRYWSVSRDSKTSFFWSSMECRQSIDGNCANSADTFNTGNYVTVPNMMDGNWHKMAMYIKFSTYQLQIWMDDTRYLNFNGTDGVYGGASPHPYIGYLTVDAEDSQTQESFTKYIDDVEIWDGMPEDDAPSTPTIRSGGIRSGGIR